jgi:2-amino-4-hydroxy-6-hydroxymethyldihydropteridine diphosphokinase
MRAGVALGSNLGDRAFHLRAARKTVMTLPRVTPPILSSAIYETEPVECEPGARAFLNAVIEFSYAGVAADLFQQLKQIELALGRPKQHAHNVSRPIDLDLLYFGEIVLDTEHLSLPHPRMLTRRFVLEPLAEIRPDLVLPGQKETIYRLLASLEQSARVVRLNIEWEPP